MRRSVSFGVFLVVACWCGAAAAAPATQPNIIFIIGDDHPWPAYGFMKAIDDSGTFPTPTQHPDLPAIETPNLDRLANRGVVFPVGQTSATVCIPSFRSTLTGLYTKDFNEDEFSERKMPQYLGDEGYVSYGYGKIWNRSYLDAGFTAGGRRTKREPRSTLDPLWEFVDSRGAGSPPWLIWYSPRLPHGPYGDSKEFRDQFDKQSFARAGAKGVKVYANVMLLDFWIGELLDGLESRGLDQDTLIVWQGSDNGFLLRGSKKRQGENGFRTIISVSWPAQIPSETVLPQMVHAVDIVPTLIDYAGGTAPGSLPGQSMRPYIENPALPGREYLFTLKVRPLRRFLRTRDGLRFGSLDTSGKKFILHDLATDPDEEVNLIDDPTYAAQIPDFKQALDDWFLP